MREIILEKLKAAFSGAEIELIGHSDDISNNKYDLQITSSLFVGLSKVQQHQLVYKELNEFLESGKMHAVSLTTLEK
jgi:stress-induced morphogen